MKWLARPFGQIKPIYFDGKWLASFAYCLSSGLANAE
jgi:hypothetical protein